MENVVVGHFGKIISSVSLQDDSLHLRFGDGTGVRIFDDKRLCCEHRYMHTDDDLSGVVGGMLYGVEIRHAPEPDYDSLVVHEVQFLVVKTSKGEVVLSTHNEHNGYYGGFRIVVCDVI